MILAVGPFTALPAMMGETATIGAPLARIASRMPGTRQDRIDAEPRVGRADDDAGERRRRRGPRAPAALGRASGRALVADVAHHRPALLAHEVVLEGQRALVGLDHRAHRVVASWAGCARRRRASPPGARRRRSASRRRASRRVRSTCVARSPSPSLNQVGPAELARARCMKVQVSLAPAPAGLLVDEAGERIERGVDVGRDVQPQVLEVVAGVDDDGEPLAQQLRQPERQLGAADAARERDVAWRASRGSSEQVLGLGPHQRRRRAAPARSSRARAPARPGGPPPPRPWPARRRRRPHRQTRPRSPPAAGRTGPSRRAGPTARARRPRRWRARPCRAARPGRRCRRR